MCCRAAAQRSRCGGVKCSQWLSIAATMAATWSSVGNASATVNMSISSAAEVINPWQCRCQQVLPHCACLGVQNRNKRLHKARVVLASN